MPPHWQVTWNRLCPKLIQELPAKPALSALQLAFNFAGTESVEDFFVQTNQRCMWTTAVAVKENLGALMTALLPFENYPAVHELKTALGT